MRQRVHRSGDQRLDITGMPSWQDRLMTFHGSVTCEPTPDGTLVTHREEFDFHGPLRRVPEALLRDWLATDVSGEVTRINALLSPSARPQSKD